MVLPESYRAYDVVLSQALPTSSDRSQRSSCAFIGLAYRPALTAFRVKREAEVEAMTGLAALGPILPPPGSDNQMFGAE